jgi:hypothetical protein
MGKGIDVINNAPSWQQTNRLLGGLVMVEKVERFGLFSRLSS